MLGLPGSVPARRLACRRESKTFVVAVAIPHATSAQNVTNQATAAAGLADPVPGNASYVDSFTIPAANLTIATSSVSMPRDGMTERKQEVAAGDVLADAYRETFGTDIGFATGGNIRNGITCNVSSATTFCPIPADRPSRLRGGRSSRHCRSSTGS